MLFLLALPFLLGTCLPSLWRPPFPLHALALILLSLAKVQLLPTLTLSPVMIWCSGQMAPFLFLLAKVALVYLPTALSVALKPLFPFQEAQFAQVFPLKPVPFCMLFAGLGSNNKSTTSLYLTLILFLPLCPLLRLFFYLKLCDRSGSDCLLSPILLGYNGSLDTRFSSETTQQMSWPDGECYLRPPQSFVVSHLLYPLLSFLQLGGYCLIEVL